MRHRAKTPAPRAAEQRCFPEASIARRSGPGRRALYFPAATQGETDALKGAGAECGPAFLVIPANPRRACSGKGATGFPPGLRLAAHGTAGLGAGETAVTHCAHGATASAWSPRGRASVPMAQEASRRIGDGPRADERRRGGSAPPRPGPFRRRSEGAGALRCFAPRMEGVECAGCRGGHERSTRVGGNGSLRWPHTSHPRLRAPWVARVELGARQRRVRGASVRHGEARIA